MDTDRLKYDEGKIQDLVCDFVEIINKYKMDIEFGDFYHLLHSVMMAECAGNKIDFLKLHMAICQQKLNEPNNKEIP